MNLFSVYEEKINKVYYFIDPSLKLTLNDNEVADIQEVIPTIQFEEIM